MVYGGPEGEGPAAAGQRLTQACSTQLGASLLHGSRLARVPPPATHQQARSLAAWALHLRLFPPSDGAPLAAHLLVGTASRQAGFLNGLACLHSNWACEMP